ncbi:MAG: helix-turn-helix transcriptional regulator [Tepidisphaeraceae bacterium]
MAKLSERDYLLLLSSVRQLTDAAMGSSSDLLRGMLKIVKRLVPCEHLTYNELPVVPSGRPFSVFDNVDAERASATRMPAFAQYLHQHPIARRQQAMPRSRAITKISDYLPDLRFRRLAIYADCYRHLDTDYQMVMPFVTDGPHIVGLAFCRKGSDFDERDRRVLTLLSPHLTQLHTLANRRESARSLTAGPDPLNESADEDDLRDRLIRDTRTTGEPLTTREADVLLWVVRGKTNPEIGMILGISPRTVQKHLEHIFLKLNVEGRAACIVQVLDALR